MLERKKKKKFGILERFLTKCTKYFFPLFFLLKTKKKTNPPPVFGGVLFWGGPSAASPLKIWDVMPPYLKTLFEQKTEF